MPASDPQLRRIGDVAAATGLSLRTLRHYDEIDLVTPSERSTGGYRLYTDHDVTRLMLIRRMKPLGYSLEDMRHVLDLLDSPSTTAEDWAPVVSGAHERREDLSQRVVMAEEFVELLERHTRSARTD